MKLSENQIIFSLNIADLIHYANSLSIGLTYGDTYSKEYLLKLYLATGDRKTMNSMQSQR